VNQQIIYSLFSFLGIIAALIIIFNQNNFIINITSFFAYILISILIGFDINIEIESVIFEVIFHLIIIIYLSIFSKKNESIIYGIVELIRKKYKILKNFFLNSKDGLLRIKRTGEIEHNKNFLKFVDNNKDIQFYEIIKRDFYYKNIKNKNIVEKVRNSLNSNNTKHPQNRNKSLSSFEKSGQYLLFLKLSIFNKIDNFNNKISRDLKNLFFSYQQKIQEIKKKFLFDDYFFNQNFEEREKLNNPVNENILNQNMRNRYQLNSDKMNTNINSGIVDENKKINNKHNSEVLNTIIENSMDIFSLEKKQNKKNKLKNLNDIIRINNHQNNFKIKLEQELNKKAQEELDKSKKMSENKENANNYFKEFANNLIDKICLEDNETYVYIGERLLGISEKKIIPKNYINQSQDINNNQDIVVNRQRYIVKNEKECIENNINTLLNKQNENEIRKIYNQKIYIRYNNEDDCVEIIFKNNKDNKKNNPDNDKIENTNEKNLFEKIFSNVLMKICHEIKNPILNLLELTKIFKELLNNQKEINLLKDIKHILKSINLIIMDLEFLSDIVRYCDDSRELINKLKMKVFKNTSIIDLKSLFEKIKKIFDKKIKFGKKGINIDLQTENLPPKIKIEHNLILICIFNILSNSIKFSTCGNINILLKYSKDTRKLILSFADQGIGIKTENLGKIGQLFYKVENPNNFHGLGLGLFAVKIITEVMNGYMRLISEYGKGTCVQLEFILVEDIIKSAYGRKNDEEIFKVLISSNELNLSFSNKSKTDKISYSSLSSYVKYLNSKFWSSCLFINKNNNLKNRPYFISNLNNKKIGDLSEIKSHCTDKSRIKTRSNSCDLNYRKIKYNIKKKLKVYDSEKIDSIKYNKLKTFYNNNYNKLKNDNRTFNININKTSSNLFSCNEDFRKNSVPYFNKAISSILIENDLNSQHNIHKFTSSNLSRDNTNSINNKDLEQINTLTTNTLKNSSLNEDNLRMNNTNSINIQLESNNISNVNLQNQNTLNDRFSDRKSRFVNINVNTLNNSSFHENTTRRKNSIINNESRLDIDYRKVGIKFDSNSEDQSSDRISNKNSSIKPSIKNTKIINHINFDDSLEAESVIIDFKKYLRILVVDDESLIRRSQITLIKKFSKREKINVFVDEACDGADCLFKIYNNYLNGFYYDLILTDETMNFMNGLLTTKIIKSLIKANIINSLKIIMVTSYEVTVIENADSNNDIDFIISKPLSMNDLEIIFRKIQRIEENE